MRWEDRFCRMKKGPLGLEIRNRDLVLGEWGGRIDRPSNFGLKLP